MATDLFQCWELKWTNGSKKINLDNYFKAKRVDRVHIGGEIFNRASGPELGLGPVVHDSINPGAGFVFGIKPRDGPGAHKVMIHAKVMAYFMSYSLNEL